MQFKISCSKRGNDQRLRSYIKKKVGKAGATPVENGTCPQSTKNEYRFLKIFFVDYIVLINRFGGFYCNDK